MLKSSQRYFSIKDQEKVATTDQSKSRLVNAFSSIFSRSTQANVDSTSPITNGIGSASVKKEISQFVEYINALCKVADGVKFMLKLQIAASLFAGAAIMGGTALLGMTINPILYEAIVPEAAIAVAAAYNIHEVKGDVDTVGDALETIKSFWEVKAEVGAGPAIVKESFRKLREALLSSSKRLMLAPAIGTMLVGVTGLATGSYYLMTVTDPTIQTISMVVVGVSGVAAVGSIPSLLICMAIYRRMKNKIVSMTDSLEQQMLARLK